MKRARRCSLIARKLRVSRTDLAEANYLSLTARVAAGQKLMVPHEATVLMAARTDRPAPAHRGARDRRRRPASSRSRPRDSEPGEGRATQVKRGDTLASIARLFKTTRRVAEDVESAPAGQTGSTAGQRLTVYRIAERTD